MVCSGIASTSHWKVRGGIAGRGIVQPRLRWGSLCACPLARKTLHQNDGILSILAIATSGGRMLRAPPSWCAPTMSLQAPCPCFAKRPRFGRPSTPKRLLWSTSDVFARILARKLGTLCSCSVPCQEQYLCVDVRILRLSSTRRSMRPACVVVLRLNVCMYVS